MRVFTWSLALLAAIVLSATAEAGRRGCGCCYAPVAASPATAATPATAAPAVAQNQASGYRSFSYQPAAAAPVYSSGYSTGNSYRGSGQPMWMNGSNKSLGRYR